MTTPSQKPARTKPEAKKAVVQYTQAAGTACRPFVVHVDEERHDLGRPVRANAAVLRLRKPPDGGQARLWVDGWRSLPDFRDNSSVNSGLSSSSTRVLKRPLRSNSFTVREPAGFTHDLGQR